MEKEASALITAAILWQTSKRRTQRLEQINIGDQVTQRAERGGDVRQEMSAAFYQSEKTISPKRLHQALHCA